jgi:hypothetical protein
MSDDHDRIWLEPKGAPDRCWCEDNVWGEEAVEYVLVDLVAIEPPVKRDELIVEIDDGCITVRMGSKSITICAETATIYDVAVDAPARKVPLNYETLSAFEAAVSAAPPNDK